MGTLSSSSSSPEKSRLTMMIRPTRFLFPIIILLIIIPTPTASSPEQHAKISYFDHCNDVVLESSFSSIPLIDTKKLSLTNSHFSYASGASDFPISSSSFALLLSSFTFRTRKVYKTQKDHVYKLDGGVLIMGLRKLGHFGNSTCHGLRLVHYRPHKIPVHDYLGYDGLFQDFAISVLWESISGKLCMVGANKRISSIYSVLKLHYPDRSNVYTSLVNGTFDVFNSDGKVIEALNIYRRVGRVQIVGVDIPLKPGIWLILCFDKYTPTHVCTCSAHACFWPE